VRTNRDDDGVLAEIGRALLSVEPDLPITAIAPLREEYDERLSREMLLARLTARLG
jgi:hypothetical protein